MRRRLNAPAQNSCRDRSSAVGLGYCFTARRQRESLRSAARGASTADIYGWMGSIATYGFITVYGLVCVALPMRLKRLQSLTQGILWIAIAAAVAMLLAFVGNLYPVPPAPYSWLPYVYLGYLLVALVIGKLMQSENRSESI